MSWTDSRLDDPIRVLVTGAASGIGGAIATAFVNSPRPTIVTGLDRDQGDQIGVTWVTGDVRDPESARTAVQVAAPSGELDVLILAAGLHDGGAGLDDIGELSHHLNEVLSVNVAGIVQPLAAAKRALLTAKGRVVVVLSDASYLAGGNGAGVVYTASKHAALGVVRWAARDLAPQVRVNGVAPGGVRTGLRVESQDGQTKHLWDAQDESHNRELRIKGGNPLGSMLSPEEVAEYVLFMAGPGARAMTGEVLRIDGGRALANGWSGTINNEGE